MRQTRVFKIRFDGECDSLCGARLAPRDAKSVTHPVRRGLVEDSESLRALQPLDFSFDQAKDPVTFIEVQPRPAVGTVYDYQSIFQAITADPRYLANLDWGQPRSGHPEGTVRAHIAEIEPNLEILRPKLNGGDQGDHAYWKLKLLIHTHDSFKAEAEPGVAIADPRSHASLARAFLAGYCDDADLLAMVQFHDEPFALYRQVEFKGTFNQDRFDALLAAIGDWNLFLAFNIIDGCTPGKSRKPLKWLFDAVAGRVESTFTDADIIPST